MRRLVNRALLQLCIHRWLSKMMWAQAGSEEGVGGHPEGVFAMSGFVHPLQK